MPTVVQLHEREGFVPAIRSGDLDRRETALQGGTPYGLSRFTPSSPSGLPCTPPPWGALAAVDLASGEQLWQVPIGRARWQDVDLHGTPIVGGPLITSSGLVFIGGTQDGTFRAMDLRTGDVLWRAELPSGGHATPMSYRWQDRQIVVIAAGGYGGLDDFGKPLSDAIVAFAPPEDD